MSDYSNFPVRALTLACLAMITGCAITQPKVPAALDFPRSGDTRAQGDFAGQRPVEPAETVIRQSPRPPAPIAGNLRPITPKVKPDEGAGNLSVTFEQISLPAFIQAVYGGILKLNYSVDPAVSARTDLITFRTPKPLSAERLTDVTEQLLRSYGLAVQDFGGVLRIVADGNTSSTLPLVRRGRAQPTVPLPLRPIFHFIETDAVRGQSLIPSLKAIMGNKVSVESDAFGAILLGGQPSDVAVALELIQVFDQPSFRAQNSKRIVPRYWASDEFVRRLSEVLRLEGYSVANQSGTADPIMITSITPINSVVVLCTSPEVLAHVMDWVRELDQLPQVQAGNAYFTYPVRNSDAQELARALNDLISGTTTAPASASVAPGAPGAAAAPTPAAGARGRRVVVNNATNSLIFQGGSQEDYRQWLSLLSELDKPVKSALIDVLVAEVALTDSNDLGFTWKLDQLGSGAQSVRLNGTTFNLQSSGKGVGIQALLGGNSLRSLVINALASNSDARVMSNPKVMTRNGESASISVGQDVPVVTSQGVSQSSGTFTSSTNVVPQTVQYRNTGVILKVRPVIHAGDRIDLDISQEVSTAEPTLTGVSSSPTIRRRSVDTKLSLRDGATVMLGGLISDSNTDSNDGVPGLKDIPFFGSLFRSQGKSRTRTELVMLITPYILNDSADAEAATDAFQGSLGPWADGMRERVSAGRAARIKRELSDNVSVPEDVRPPSPALPRPVRPAPVPNSAPAPAGEPSGAVPAQESQAPRMINFGNANAAPETGAAPGGFNQPAGQADGNTPQGIPPGRKAPPEKINGITVPSGTTEVDDPKLKQELLDLLRKK
jgi:general secretion pathway protein D